MEKTISKNIRTIFFVHMIIDLILGITLWLVPGRTLTFLGWVPETIELAEFGISTPGTTFVDNVLTRILGAALLGMAFSGFRGWRAEHEEQIRLMVEFQFVFSALALIGALAGFYLMNRPVPVIGWVIAAVLAIFTFLWGWSLRR